MPFLSDQFQQKRSARGKGSKILKTKREEKMNETKRDVKFYKQFH